MEGLSCNFFNPNWENPIDQNDPFESALSSIVSSPTASNANGSNVNNGGDNNVVRELIGRLGSICNSPFANNAASCYSTPLNSPPKLNLSAMESQNLQIHGNPLPPFPFSTDPGFVERAARFSCFGQTGLGEIGAKLGSGKISRVSSNHSIKIPGSQERTEIGDSREISSISEQIPSGEIGFNIQNDPVSRKRKSAQKGKGKENPAPAKDANVGSESNESSAKRSKSADDGSKSENDAVEKNNGNGKSKDNSKASEPPKDYIHVRARRGQATDAHSLAERVRREKISERMKLLQDLVPGCDKVTGKAVMLDEIINYVQSLQRQVEFLSMKLSTVNPRMNLEALVSKDIFQSRESLPPNMYPSDCYPFQSQPNLHTAITNGTEELNHFNAALTRNQLPSMNNFNETASQVSTLWENDLHNVVQMGYSQNQSQDFHGAQMKVEP